MDITLFRLLQIRDEDITLNDFATGYGRERAFWTYSAIPRRRCHTGAAQEARPMQFGWADRPAHGTL
jgi:hypothetical protein